MNISYPLGTILWGATSRGSHKSSLSFAASTLAKIRLFLLYRNKRLCTSTACFTQFSYCLWRAYCVLGLRETAKIGMTAHLTELMRRAESRGHQPSVIHLVFETHE